MNSGVMAGVVTAILLAAFLYGVYWAWSDRRRTDFDEAARLPLDDDDLVKGEQQ